MTISDTETMMHEGTDMRVRRGRAPVTTGRRGTLIAGGRHPAHETSSLRGMTTTGRTEHAQMQITGNQEIIRHKDLSRPDPAGGLARRLRLVRAVHCPQKVSGKRSIVYRDLR